MDLAKIIANAGSRYSIKKSAVLAFRKTEKISSIWVWDQQSIPSLQSNLSAVSVTIKVLWLIFIMVNDGGRSLVGCVVAKNKSVSWRMLLCVEKFFSFVLLKWV